MTEVVSLILSEFIKLKISATIKNEEQKRYLSKKLYFTLVSRWFDSMSAIYGTDLYW